MACFFFFKTIRKLGPNHKGVVCYLVDVQYRNAKVMVEQIGKLAVITYF